MTDNDLLSSIAHPLRGGFDPVTIVLGGGQHARVVIDAIHSAGMLPPIAILDNEPRLWGTSLSCVPIVGGDDKIDQLVADGATHFVVGVGSTGNTSVRRKLFALGTAHGLHPLTVRHPSAVCSSMAMIACGAQIMPGVLVSTAAQVGTNAILNTGAIVEHDCVIGPHAHIATGAKLAGSVRVEMGAHVGIGASVLQGIVVGARSVVGAGAVVIEDVPPDSIVVGVPARLLRRSAA